MTGQEAINAAVADARQQVIDNARANIALARENILANDPTAPVAPMPEARPALTYDDYMRSGNLRELMNYGLPEAYQRSGIYYSPPGARAGYEDYGFPAPIHQSSPYATATGRAFTMPNGGLGWQALQGFPSAYPHVLNGAPRDFWSIIGPYMPPLWQMPTWQPPASRQAAPAARGAAAPGARGSKAPAKQAATTPPAEQPVLTPGNYDETTWRDRPMPRPYDETEWRNLTMPLPPGAIGQMIPEGSGAAIRTPEMQAPFNPDWLDPNWRSDRISQPPVVPQLMTPEEAAATGEVELPTPVVPAAPRPAAPYLHTNSPGLEPRNAASLGRMLFPNGVPQVQMPQPQPPLQMPPAIPVPQIVTPIAAPQAVPQAVTPPSQVLPPVRNADGSLAAFSQTNPEYFIAP